MKTTTRIKGNQLPAYLNGRPRADLVEAFSATPTRVVEFVAAPAATAVAVRPAA